MYLHVQIGEEEPIIYALDRDEILIGSNPSGDIVIDRKEISRKHLKVLCEGSDCYVIDQGSSNGSFIAGERLIPGKREPFFAASPVSLGSEVYISIVKDLVPGKVRRLQPQRKEALAEADKTRVISLKELKAQQLLQKKKKKKKLALRYKRMENLKRKKKDQAPIKRSLKIAGAFLLVGFLLNKYKGSLSEQVFEEKKRSTALIQKNFSKEIAELSEDIKIPRESLPSREVFEELLTDEKCFSKKEIALCSLSPVLREGNAGVIKAMDSYLFYFKGDSETSKSFLDKFIKDNSGKIVAINSRGNFFFVFFSIQDEKPILEKVYAIRAKILYQLLLSPLSEDKSLMRTENSPWRIIH
jgi:pSer/pThr/pTyr-binding forkhead associated (FHA) protein